MGLLSIICLDKRLNRIRKEKKKNKKREIMKVVGNAPLQTLCKQ